MKRTLGLLILSLVLTQAVTACRSSEDRTIYKSTYMQPKSVYAVYKPSNETAWSYDIPPQHQLLVELDGEGGSIFAVSENLPTKLIWALYPINTNRGLFNAERMVGSAIESGEVELTGSAIIVGSTVGSPINPTDIPADRSIEEIEQDLPEPDAPAGPDQSDNLPEPDEDPLLDQVVE